METLRFLVRGQMIRKDPKSPFQKMVAGSRNYYEAEFDLDSAWNGYACLARFRADNKVEYAVLVSGKTIFPDDILEYREFFVSIVGKKGESQLVTNESRVLQTGGK